MNKSESKQSLESEKEWREIFARQESSGLSARKFCEQEGIKEWRFFNRRIRLLGPIKAYQQPSAGLVESKTSVGFTEIGVAETRVGKARIDNDWAIEVVLGNGAIVRIRG